MEDPSLTIYVHTSVFELINPDYMTTIIHQRHTQTD